MRETGISDRLNTETAPAHFVVQPSKYVQKMKSVSGRDYDSMRVEYIRGKALDDVDREWLQRNSFSVMKKVAHGLAEMNLKYGLVHGDLHWGNVIATRKGLKSKVKFIDFERAAPITGEKRQMSNEFMNAYAITLIAAKSEAERKKLWNFFLAEYEKKAKEL